MNPPRRDTRALGPAGMFGGKAPLSGAEEQTARAFRIQGLCDVHLLTFFANGEYKLACLFVLGVAGLLG